MFVNPSCGAAAAVLGFGWEFPGSALCQLRCVGHSAMAYAPSTDGPVRHADGNWSVDDQTWLSSGGRSQLGGLVLTKRESRGHGRSAGASRACISVAAAVGVPGLLGGTFASLQSAAPWPEAAAAWPQVSLIAGA